MKVLHEFPAPSVRHRISALLLLAGMVLAASVLPGSVAAPPAPGSAPPSGEPSRVVLKGEIVDLACYLMHEGQGESHAACAQACVKAGAPVGLLADGALYVLFAPHDTTAPFEEAKRLVGRNATVTGIRHDRRGLRGLAVTMVAAKS